MRPNWFVGLVVPDTGSWLDARVGPAPPRVRRFDSEDLHATLAFLGAVDEGSARAGFGAAVEVLPGPVSVGLGPIVGMGPRDRWTALSATLEDGRDVLADAIGRVRSPVLAAAGARPDHRAPLPHVTVARLSRRASVDERRAAEAWARSIDLAGVRLRIAEVALYTWSEDRAARLFQIVARRPVAGTA